MEYLKTYYSLEKHLEETVRVNPQFEILNSIWKLNKKNLSLALDNVNQYFPHYSLHEKSHSNTIIHNIESFLGEDRIKRLSPTDTWLILMAAFTHDLGMVVFHELVEKSWPSKEFQEFLGDICEWDDIDMKESGELLVKLQKIKQNDLTKENEWIDSISPIKIKNAVTIVIAEYIRRIHHKRSADILQGVDKAFAEVANSFYSDQIPNRLLNILGEVAYLHGVQFYDIFDRLDYQANGISSDKVHPRFIAAMLRLGDLLDIDDNRFNAFTEKTFKSPQTSHQHRRKHSSIKHFLITPQAIEITADCPDESVYRLARNWFDWLEKEVENQSKEWYNITPEEIGGTSPQIPKGKIRVYYQGNKAPNDLLNLRFQISNEKIFQILEGSSIYEEPGLTFIRELIQNGLDASKIQLWREIDKGTYDFAFREQWKDASLSHQEIIENIKFPSDIPEYLAKSLTVNLKVEWENEERKNLLIIVEDFGTGISDHTLLRMTNRVGESRKQEVGYNEMLSRMPFWLRPTGAFGIGIQSVFIVVESFKVNTRAEGEDAKEIVFRSARKGKYSSWTVGNDDRMRGTKITVSIPVEKFEEVFGTSFEWRIISNYDYFTDNHDNIYTLKIRDYVLKMLSQIDNVQVNFMGHDLLSEGREVIKPVYFNETPYRFEDFELQIIYQDSGLLFYVSEKVVGSDFSLFFFEDGPLNARSENFDYEAKFYVRDIPVESIRNPYYRLHYSQLQWNFTGPQSDRLLNLNRDKFIGKYRNSLVDDFFNKVIPKVINAIEEELNKNYKAIINFNKITSKIIAIVYYKILLTKIANELEISIINNELLGSFTMDTNLVSYIDGSPCTYSILLEASEIIVVLPIMYNNIRDKSTIINEEIKTLEEDFCSNDILYKSTSFYYPYLINAYSVKEIYLTERAIFFRMQKDSSSKNEAVVIRKGEEHYLRRFLSPSHRLNRRWNYSSDKYASKISVQNIRNTGFEEFQTFSKSSIISPFKSEDAYRNLKSEVAKFDNDRNAIANFLTLEKIKQYVTPSLIKWIIEHHEPSQKLTEEIIIEGYRDLITDLLLLPE